ncbi:uncharacterized protein LTR77_005915 [Saxophila tyrrhenica]|uniref:FAD/NAD(P)-binding domain-containing protein n=1 Tax=Saxophila tyrrhenica TaxID=1690608 RepID=A0AAV9P8J7_9PEZI|nr:hypothetical protein LTR77_005915 [Saxophila tyrrhenica]
MATAVVDTLIIGGGPAGLSAAVALARHAHTAIILDSKAYRNAGVQHMHNVPGFDHASPADFRGKVLQDLKQRYHSIEHIAASINTLSKREDGVFEAVDNRGKYYHGRKLILATGVRDRLEDEVPGYAECWGKGVFHCLYCHGYEERGADSVGVLAGGQNTTPDMVMHVTKMAKRLAKKVTIYTHRSAEMVEPLRNRIHSSKISIDTRPVASLSLVDRGPQVEVTFEDGSSVVEGFIASHPKVEQHAEHLIRQLGLETTSGGEIQVQPPFNATNNPGCFAVGDSATPFKSVLAAMQAGNFAGVGAASQLQSELEERDLL